MARYIADGAQVSLVTCTLGERGEILVPEWEQFTPQQLGEHRIEELRTAMGFIGLTDHEFLGGVGRYHDTGMTRTDDGRIVVPEDAPPNAFWFADLLEAANHLVRVIRTRRPQVMVTYNPIGGYGHPDHIQAHRVAMYAMQLAAAPSHEPQLGEPWQVSRVVWGTHNTMMFKRAFEYAKEQGMELWEDGDERDPSSFGPPEELIEAVVPIGDFFDVCRKALGSHRSQVRIEDKFWQLHGMVQQLPEAGEAYMFGAGVPFPESEGLHDDLFAGLT